MLCSSNSRTNACYSSDLQPPLKMHTLSSPVLSADGKMCTMIGSRLVFAYRRITFHNINTYLNTLIFHLVNPLFNRIFSVFLAQFNPSQSVGGSDLVEALSVLVALLALSDTRFSSLSSSSPEPAALLEPSPPRFSCDPLHSPVCKSQARKGGWHWAGCRLMPGGPEGYPS